MLYSLHQMPLITSKSQLIAWRDFDIFRCVYMLFTLEGDLENLGFFSSTLENSKTIFLTSFSLLKTCNIFDKNKEI